jgi:hypothetical protein
MEIVTQPEYIITYHYSHPIRNKKINEMFNHFYNSFQNQIDISRCPENLFQLANCIIIIFNDRHNTRDTEDYVNKSTTIWNKLKSFQILYDFYRDIQSDEINERNLKNIYESNSIIYDFDTIKILQYKKQTLIDYYKNITDLYNEILIRINSHKNSNIFQFQMYKNKIIKNLNTNTLQKSIVFNMIENSIEKNRKKNHCRAVLKQCINQNFGYPHLKTIENCLVYKIDSFIY